MQHKMKLLKKSENLWSDVKDNPRVRPPHPSHSITSNLLSFFPSAQNDKMVRETILTSEKKAQLFHFHPILSSLTFT